MPRWPTEGSPWRSELHRLAAEATDLPREQAYKRLGELLHQATSEEDRAIIAGFGEALEMARIRRRRYGQGQAGSVGSRARKPSRRRR
ncbi:MAG: hypothetical protein RDU83_06200 [bacterium]|nr:hypothetical protein [bacterium]